MIKAIFRLLHFLLCFVVYFKKALAMKVERLKRNFRYKVLWLIHFADTSRMLQATNQRMTKKALHSCIIVNNQQGDSSTAEGLSKQEILKVSEVLSWMILTGTKQVTIFD